MADEAATVVAEMVRVDTMVRARVDVSGVRVREMPLTRPMNTDECLSVTERRGFVALCVHTTRQLVDAGREMEPMPDVPDSLKPSMQQLVELVFKTEELYIGHMLAASELIRAIGPVVGRTAIPRMLRVRYMCCTLRRHYDETLVHQYGTAKVSSTSVLDLSLYRGLWNASTCLEFGADCDEDGVSQFFSDLVRHDIV